MTLIKLHIQPMRQSGSKLVASSLSPFYVPFNPTSYSITKTVSWGSQLTVPNTGNGTGVGNQRAIARQLDAPGLEFGGGMSRTLIMELFFDATEDMASPKDVRNQTNRIVALTRIERKGGQPPICLLSWGQAPSNSDFPFFGVITSLTQNFLLFDQSGTPLRARLNVTFTEYNDPKQNLKQTDPDLTTHQVMRGDTLPAIAERWYGNPAEWRAIALANRIDNPRQLEIGARLVIPSLR
jgi:hypothetical protein